MTDLEFLTKLLDLLRFCKKDYPMRMGVGDELADMIEEVEQRIQAPAMTGSNNDFDNLRQAIIDALKTHAVTDAVVQVESSVGNFKIFVSPISQP